MVVSSAEFGETVPFDAFEHVDSAEGNESEVSPEGAASMIKWRNFNIADEIAKEFENGFEFEPVLNNHCCIDGLAQSLHNLSQLLQLIFRVSVRFILKHCNFSLLLKEILQIHSFDLIVPHFNGPFHCEIIAVGDGLALGAKMEELADPHVEVVVVLVPVLEGDGFTDFVG
jgi:hypothetical protein